MLRHLLSFQRVSYASLLLHRSAKTPFLHRPPLRFPHVRAALPGPPFPRFSSASSFKHVAHPSTIEPSTSQNPALSASHPSEAETVARLQARITELEAEQRLLNKLLTEHSVIEFEKKKKPKAASAALSSTRAKVSVTAGNSSEALRPDSATSSTPLPSGAAPAPSDLVENNTLSVSDANAASPPAEPIGKETIELRLKLLLRSHTFREVLDATHPHITAKHLRTSIGAFAAQYATKLSPGLLSALLKDLKRDSVLEHDTCTLVLPIFAEWYQSFSSSNSRLLPLDDEDETASVFGPSAPAGGSMAGASSVTVSDTGSSSSSSSGNKVKPASSLRELTDLTLPHRWFPHARTMKRKIIAHIGPTNSGKTHAALQRLAKAGTGVYCGPLRLLAWEVHEKLNAAGTPCNLLTGQELIEIPHAQHVSCTVEMADTTREVDCVVIDEFQMVGSEDRGSSWTRAFLGMPAKEVHVCGDPTMTSILSELCAITGDELSINTYQRLSPLNFCDSVTDFSNITRGDCVVAFSRKEIYALKKEIEKSTRLKCCVIYGSLPPETRRQQAELFNRSDSEYDVLVASDAVGMGLNLNIRRMVFSSIEKFDGKRVRSLTTSETRQIGGRAGRFNSAYANGFITSFHGEDLDHLVRSYNRQPKQLKKAGLFPTFEILANYMAARPNVPFAKVLQAFENTGALDSSYFLCSIDDMKQIATVLERIPLSAQDRYIFCLAPVDVRDAFELEYLIQYASLFARGQHVPVGVKVGYRIPETAEELKRLEELHSVLDMYVWLSRRFIDSFDERDRALEEKAEIGRMIEEGLSRLSAYRSKKRGRRYHERRREEAWFRGEEEDS